MREAMEGEPPVLLHLFDKAYGFRGQIPSPVSVEWLGVWGGGGSLVFTVPADNPRISRLLTPGSRVACTLKRPGYIEPKTLISGPVSEWKGEGIEHLPTRVFTVRDDFDEVFQGIVGWPVPAAAITAQGTAAYHVVTGPAETVVRTLVSANAPRQGVPVTVAASAGLGPSLTVKVRMHPLYDRLFPKIADLGLGVRVVQVPGESVRRLLTWIPTTHTRVLTEESGVILPGAEIVVQAPKATRVVVAAGGDGTARVFRQYIDSAAESKWGISRAITVDARDVDPADPNLSTILQERADEALAENQEVSSLSMELTETDAWQFGTAFELGDMLPVRLSGQDTITDRVNEVQMTWTAGDGGGLEITPRVGAYEESPDDRMYKLLARALKASRNLEVTK
jgi:ReqiPepy6 Gp37-like protein